MCKHDHAGGCGCGCETQSQCGAIADERNRFYTGKYMTARDFRDEQEYFLSRHRLHNRLMHGWGVVCGLGVDRHTSAQCPGHVIVNPGIAIDCCGRELVLREQEVVAVWLPPEKAGAGAPPDTKPELPATLQYLLYMHYEEQQIERVPALYADDCSAKRLEANRIREVAGLAVIPWDDAHRNDPRYKGCWPERGVNLEPCSKGCGGEGKEAGCIEPACACSLGVPLALITLEREGDGYRIAEGGIAIDGRETLPPPREYLTHIVKTNWVHGGKMSLAELRAPTGRAGLLKIYFDRRLDISTNASSAGTNYGVGVNQCTFIAQLHRPGDVQYPVTMLYYDKQPPYWDATECAAVFPIDPRLLRGGATLNDTVLHITLKCDFILDCNGLAVDGDYQRGKLPSGDGIEGGTFESWFLVGEPYKKPEPEEA
jgi:hypothetical protein